MEIDWSRPDYRGEYSRRSKALSRIHERLEEDPESIGVLRQYYATHPWDYIRDWGVTFDPRLLERGLPATIPFLLWPRQDEFLKWIYEMWRGGERGLVEKSRDCGVTWLCVGFAVTMWLFVPGFTVGFGSRKEDLVDKKGDPDCIFEKIRFFFSYTPDVFRPTGFVPRTHDGFMKMLNPENGAVIAGEAGDNIGRGGRKSIQFVDEAAFVERQELVDRALSQATNCQIDVSTPNGNGNAFYNKRMRWNNTNKVFVFDWRDDPRKDQSWYKKMKAELDEVTVAQEIDRDYNASQEDVFIPAKWVKASIDAHRRLGFHGEGIRATGFDPADVGDAKALVNRHGSVVTGAFQKKDGDITQAIPWAFELADRHRADVIGYDADGMGAPTMKMALKRMAAGRCRVVAYHGSAGVQDPGKALKVIKLQHKNFVTGRTAMTETSLKTNSDTYRNFRSQTWSWVRDRFEATYRSVQAAEQGHIVNADPDELISIDSSCECLQELVAELSRPMRIYTDNGKILVESKKNMKRRGIDSPNLADALVIAFAQKHEEEKKQSMPFEFETYGPAVKGVM